MKHTWLNLKKPFYILAPMEDVTDTVFRRVITSCGRPDLFFTEFTNVDGMFSKGESYVGQRLLFTPEEKPIIAQIWGLEPNNFYKAAKKIVAMGFDGIDLNMGCPQKDVIKKGACAALMNNHTLAEEIIRATKEGAGDLPISVKTRIGFKTIILEDWIGFLLDQEIAALTVHGRTVKEMSAVPAHWDQIGKVVKIRDAKKLSTYIIGNGDVKSLYDAKEKAKQYNLDGIMIGRGIFNNPWMFNPKINIENVTLNERLDLLLLHLDLWEKTWGDKKNFQILKKYFKIYISGFDGAQDIRMKLMETNNAEQVRQVISNMSS